MGRLIQTPFARPPDHGHSARVVNVVRGAFDLLIAGLLLIRGAAIAAGHTQDAPAPGRGGLLPGLAWVHHSGSLNGGEARGNP